ncbi:carboxylesterase NlhH [Oxobacter pfennigii]|uniref:Carboxylesterase NlhH n=1 Tax=Oxobacter pfennigii TaxID=36849 RepID=A0A0P9AE60_9CLOT|nr:alpha/beta hydrolase [Oxobacter pfennigii]KPU43553.1 carboxylesterase NlhH [Oxobacter pfennigii]
MDRIPEEKIYTREELIKEIRMMKQMAANSSAGMPPSKRPVGKEIFLDTNVGKIRVLAYNLDNPNKLPLFVNIHAGGFISGNPEMDDPYMMNVAINANAKILNIDYSLAPESPFPQALNDCYAVIKYACEHPEEFNIDKDNIAVGGHSAGGNLTAAICIKNAGLKELNIKCVILDYPAMDIYTDPYLKPKGGGRAAETFLNPSMFRLFNASYCLKKEERKNPLISPLYASKEQLETFPPALIITAGMDSLCKEAEDFRDLLIAAGVDATHKRFENSDHGFTMSDMPDAKEGWGLMIDHLNKYLN